MYFIVYTVTMTVGDFEVDAEYYHGLLPPGFKLRLLGKRFAFKCLNKSACQSWNRNIGSSPGFPSPTFRRRLRAVDLKRLVPSEGRSRPFYKTKLRQSLPVVKKEEVSPLPQQNLNSPCETSLQKLGNVNHGCSGGVSESVNWNWSPAETSAWLQSNRYTTHIPTLSSYSGADLLRLSRDDLVQLCGLPDGIRLYNALPARGVAPRLTVYMCSGNSEKVYQAIFLSMLTSSELVAKLAALLDISAVSITGLYMEGPNGIRVVVNDELVSHIADQSTFTVEITARDAANSRYQLLLKQTHFQPPS